MTKSPLSWRLFQVLFQLSVILVPAAGFEGRRSGWIMLGRLAYSV